MKQANTIQHTAVCWHLTAVWNNDQCSMKRQTTCVQEFDCWTMNTVSRSMSTNKEMAASGNVKFLYERKSNTFHICTSIKSYIKSKKNTNNAKISHFSYHFKKNNKTNNKKAQKWFGNNLLITHTPLLQEASAPWTVLTIVESTQISWQHTREKKRGLFRETALIIQTVQK